MLVLLVSKLIYFFNIMRVIVLCYHSGQGIQVSLIDWHPVSEKCVSQQF